MWRCSASRLNFLPQESQGWSCIGAIAWIMYSYNTYYLHLNYYHLWVTSGFAASILSSKLVILSLLKSPSESASSSSLPSSSSFPKASSSSGSSRMTSARAAVSTVISLKSPLSATRPGQLKHFSINWTFQFGDTNQDIRQKCQGFGMNWNEVVFKESSRLSSIWVQCCNKMCKSSSWFSMVLGIGAEARGSVANKLLENNWAKSGQWHGWVWPTGAFQLPHAANQPIIWQQFNCRHRS